MSVADVDFTGNDSVIGADGIKWVVRLRVFEAILEAALFHRLYT